MFQVSAPGEGSVRPPEEDHRHPELPHAAGQERLTEVLKRLFIICLSQFNIRKNAWLYGERVEKIYKERGLL